MLALKNLLDILKFKDIKLTNLKLIKEKIASDPDFLKLLGIPVVVILVLILIGYLFETRILDILLFDFFSFGLIFAFPREGSMKRNKNLTKLAGALLLICVSISIIFSIIFAIYNSETAKNLAILTFVGFIVIFSLILGTWALILEIYKERREGVVTIIDFLGFSFLVAAGASSILDFFFQIKFLISGQSYSIVIIIGGILTIIAFLLDKIMGIGIFYF